MTRWPDMGLHGMAEANDGVASLHHAPVESKRTIIATGLARSGTSMVAALLHDAGLYLGSDMDPVVREDREVASRLGTTRLNELIAWRNRRYPVWGFKHPNLHVFGPGVVQAFRNPRVIVTSRDPVAIGRRDLLSEHRADELASRQIQAAAYESFAMVKFADALSCPVLLLSYEKALQDPRRLATAVLGFCGLKADAADVALAVKPNNPAYLGNTERHFLGHIDDVLNNIVYGWAAERGSDLPQTLEVLVDDQLITTVIASEFRADLMEQGIGAGRHGFRLALPALMRPDAKLTIRVLGRTYQLIGSGSELKTWTRQR